MTNISQSLVANALKGLRVYQQYHSLYTQAELSIISLRTQCSCIDFALQEIQDIILRTSARLASDERLSDKFEFVLGACHMTFALLNERLSKLIVVAQNEYGRLQTKDKLKHLWNSSEMKELRDNIQGQAMAVHLLLTTLQA